jgi:hypothetical protein
MRQIFRAAGIQIVAPIGFLFDHALLDQLADVGGNAYRDKRMVVVEEFATTVPQDIVLQDNLSPTGS